MSILRDIRKELFYALWWRTKIFRGSRKQSKAAERTPGKYFLRAVMAGFFIVVAMIFSNVVGNTFQSTDPAWGKLLGGIVFAIAVLLIV